MNESTCLYYLIYKVGPSYFPNCQGIPKKNKKEEKREETKNLEKMKLLILKKTSNKRDSNKENCNILPPK